MDRILYQGETQPVPASSLDSFQESRWHQPWSEPVRHKIAPALAIALIASGVSAPFINVPFLRQEAFAAGWSQPPAQIRQVQYQATTRPVSVVAEDIFADKWFKPFSEPVRIKLGLLASLQQVSPENPFGLTQPESVTEDRWHQPWSEPVRFKPRLIEGGQQDFAFHSAPQVSFSWFNNLSEPVRILPALPTYQQHYFEFQPTPIINIGWFGPLSDPSVLSSPRLFEASQRAFTTDLNPIVSFSWFNNLSDPVRTPPRLQEGLQQDFTFNPNPFVSFGWYGWLSDPVRTPPRLLEGIQQTLAFNPIPIVPKDWYNWLSEPVRIKPGLLADLQPSFYFSQFVFVEQIFPDKWYANFSLPVRYPQILLPGLQQSLLQVISPITLYLQATETPDVMAAALARYSELTGARVSVVEIVPNFAYLSSVVVSTVYAHVGIVEVSS